MNYLRNSFHKAAEAMELLSSKFDLAERIQKALIYSQKFVIPDAGQMVVGRDVSEFAEVMQLPYPCISILRDVPIGRYRTQQICVAMTLDFAKLQDAEDCDFCICDVMQNPNEKDHWLPTRILGVSVTNIDGIIGYDLLEIADFANQELSITRTAKVADELSIGFDAVTELMMMLSLSNVGTRKINAPEKLNKKRLRSGKLPLYDYHVLTIDGSDVCDISGSEQSDRVIRSHFRRGHIRKLGDGRKIWVRATFVHGKADGFVDKDYLVKVPIDA